MGAFMAKSSRLLSYPLWPHSNVIEYANSPLWLRDLELHLNWRPRITLRIFAFLCGNATPGHSETQLGPLIQLFLQYIRIRADKESPLTSPSESTPRWFASNGPILYHMVRKMFSVLATDGESNKKGMPKFFEFIGLWQRRCVSDYYLHDE